jgi:hypothetical protein
MENTMGMAYLKITCESSSCKYSPILCLFFLISEMKILSNLFALINVIQVPACMYKQG